MVERKRIFTLWGTIIYQNRLHLTHHASGFFILDKRRIYISTSALRCAVMFQKDGALDALAFAVLGKLLFTNSIMYNATKRSIISTFHVSLSKLNKILEYGKRHEFFHFENGHLFFDKLTDKKCYKVNLDVKGKDYTLRQIRDLLMGLDLANQVKLQNDSNHRYAHSSSTCQRVRGNKQQQRKPTNEVCKTHYGMSLTKMSHILNVCRTKARSIRNQIIGKGLIERRFHYVQTSIDPRNFNAREVNKWYRKSGLFGYLLHGADDSVVCQVQNIYQVDNDKLHFRYEH